MLPGPINTFKFSLERQTEFAVLSGDWNPMHMDSALARRTQSGRPVVHGIHTLLRALDCLAASFPCLLFPSRLGVRFSAPVYVNDTVAFCLMESSDRQIWIKAYVDGMMVADLKIVPGGIERPQDNLPFDPPDGRVLCHELLLAEMADRSGTVPPAAGTNEINTLFPDASKWLGIERVGALLGLSRLVGMECPGLHSLFIGVTVEFLVADTPSSLQYHVVKLDERLRILEIDVCGLGVRGSVKAFARHPPVGQESITDLSTLVQPEEFAGQRALIVGGSRGLGELTAKLIAAGGGCPTITYSVGKEDAERVAAEIKQFGANCDILRYDIHISPEQQLIQLGGPVSHVYYFATGQIFPRRTKEFDPALLEEFLQFYVRGFYELCATLRESFKQGISVFYPSSVVENRPRNMTEYAMAKAAGESLCSELNRSWPTVRIASVRLPRLLTDQTSTMMPAKRQNSVDVILPIVREVQRHQF